MKISKIQITDNRFFIQNRKQSNNTRKADFTPLRSNAYMDFNINFRGRTPENFYAQEFNVRYMPDTMKRYLNKDYDERKHIPPEQVMSESFKFLEAADNVSDAKNIYSTEPLFANLHEATLKNRTGILYDIKTAKELSDTPLFKNGQNDFGLYLLKKIYLEGKTIREINKDFYEKDLNPEYKGIITKPINHGTTSAYGIQYPKTDFWNSFIATREEYKKFFVNLPKHSRAELKKELTKKSSASSVNTEKDKKVEEPHIRKYSIKKYQKQQLKDDIKKTKGNAEAIEKAVRKHFTKNDPEASFIVKYLSPIMTVAADRIHLSEEEKAFADSEKAAGRKVEDLFAKFWKANPYLLEQYSTAITDTIELFEETYESGGMIPINSDYQVIKEGTKNQTPIDFVPKRFVELLDYVQNIVPERTKAYAEHEKLQQEWNEHFLNRYGEVKPEEKPAQIIINKTANEILEETAKQNNATVYHLKGINGEDFAITANLDEALAEYIMRNRYGMPRRYINALVKQALKNPLMTENAKLSFATLNMADKLEDERILGQAECDCIMNSIFYDTPLEAQIASIATLDTFASLSDEPQKLYRSTLGVKIPGLEDAQEYGAVLVKNVDKPEVQKKLDELYSFYKKPLSNSEVIKILQIFLNFIQDYDLNFAKTKDSVLYQDNSTIDYISQLQQRMMLKKFKSKIRSTMYQVISNLNISKTLLLKDITPKQYYAKCELIAHTILTR